MGVDNVESKKIDFLGYQFDNKFLVSYLSDYYSQSYHAFCIGGGEGAGGCSGATKKVVRTQKLTVSWKLSISCGAF